MHIQFAELPVADRDWRWIELRFPDAETTLHLLPREDEEASAGPVMVLVADHLEDVVSRLRSTGVEITSEPQPSPWQPGVTIAELRDSEGNRIGVSGR